MAGIFAPTVALKLIVNVLPDGIVVPAGRLNVTNSRKGATVGGVTTAVKTTGVTVGTVAGATGSVVIVAVVVAPGK